MRPVNHRLPNGQKVEARVPGVLQERIDEAGNTRRIKVGAEAHEQDEKGQRQKNGWASSHSW